VLLIQWSLAIGGLYGLYILAEAVMAMADEWRWKNERRFSRLVESLKIQKGLR
jgi:hypothetical protein